MQHPYANLIAAILAVHGPQDEKSLVRIAAQVTGRNANKDRDLVAGLRGGAYALQYRRLVATWDHFTGTKPSLIWLQGGAWACILKVPAAAWGEMHKGKRYAVSAHRVEQPSAAAAMLLKGT